MTLFGSLLAAGVWAGASASLLTSVRWGDALAVAVACAALATGAWGRRSAATLALMAVICLAMAQGAAARDRALRPPIVAWFDAAPGGDAPVLIDGVLAADAARVAGGVQLLINVSTVRDATGWHRAPGRVQAHVAGDLAAGHARLWTAGRHIRAPMTLRRPQVLMNFGGASPRWQALRRRFALTGSVKSAALVEVWRGAWWNEAAAALRRRVREAAARFVAPRAPQAAAIVTAILIGDRAGLDADVERRLQAAGTYHVIAISGGNVALLTAMCYGLSRLLVRSARAVAALTLVGVLAYGWVVGGDPSVARAVTAASLYLGASLVGLLPAPLAVLRTAAVLLVLLNPLTVVDAGAWLSFGATLGIVLFAGRWARAVRWDAAPQWLTVVLRPLVVLIVATFAAEIVLLPIAAAVFGRVSLAGLLLNLVAIPAMAAVQIAGLVTVAAASWWPAGAGLSGEVARLSADALVGSSALVDRWPWLSWRVPPASVWWTVAYFAGGACAMTPGLRRWHRVALGCAALSLIAILITPGTERAGPRPGRLRITFLDVGQGDATLVQGPGGYALLVDAGGTTSAFDIGGRVVTPAVWALGVRRLSSLALTHGDRDHVGGALTVARDLAPQEIWEGVPVPPDADRAGLRAATAAMGMGWRTVQAGARLELGEVSIEAVHPPAPEWERQKVRNDDSIVLCVRYGQVEVWLMGDAGAESEARLPGDIGAARLRILKVGHHGSRTSTSARFVDALRPQIAIVSAGRGNLFGHPAPEVMARLAASGASIFRTDRDGAVVIETDGVTVRVQTALGRSWSVSAPSGPS